jgi:hypothetical protein
MQYHRDIDTLRGLIQDTLAPPPPEPKTAMSTSIVIGSAGVLLGCLVGIVAIHNAHATPTTANASTTTISAATAIPTAPTTPSATATPTATATATATGTVDVDGTAGATVFDGDQLVGKIPLTFTTSIGEHTLRIEDATSKKSALVKIVVTDATVASVRVDGPKHAHTIHRVIHVPRGGAVVRERTRGASAADIAGAKADLAQAQSINAL